MTSRISIMFVFNFLWLSVRSFKGPLRNMFFYVTCPTCQQPIRVHQEIVCWKHQPLRPVNWVLTSFSFNFTQTVNWASFYFMLAHCIFDLLISLSMRVTLLSCTLNFSYWVFLNQIKMHEQRILFILFYIFFMIWVGFLFALLCIGFPGIYL